MTRSRAMCIGALLGLLISRPEAAEAQPGPAEAVDGRDDGGARDEEARTRFSAARMAFADGRFEDALHDFQRAYELSGRSELLFNIASTAERLRRDADALEAYEAYLEAVPEAENRTFVESRIRTLREQLAEREAARAAQSAETEASVLGADLTRDPPERRLVRNPWLWGGVGAFVVTGVIVTALLARSSSPGASDLDGFVGTDGMAHEALTVLRW